MNRPQRAALRWQNAAWERSAAERGAAERAGQRWFCQRELFPGGRFTLAGHGVVRVGVVRPTGRTWNLPEGLGHGDTGQVGVAVDDVVAGHHGASRCALVERHADRVAAACHDLHLFFELAPNH